jgi:dihydrolipoamide dehydrogenase
VAANGRSLIHGQTLGLAKLLSDAETGEILGAHLAGPNVTEMIAGIAAAMRAEATIEELAETIFPHPSVSEIILEAAHDTEGLSVHKA